MIFSINYFTFSHFLDISVCFYFIIYLFVYLFCLLLKLKYRYEGDLIGMVIGTLEEYFETEIQQLMDSYVRRFVCFHFSDYYYFYSFLLISYYYRHKSVWTDLFSGIITILEVIIIINNFKKRYAEEMLTKKHAFNQATVEKMNDDISNIRDFFLQHVKAQFFESQIKALEDLKELMDSYVLFCFSFFFFIYSFYFLFF